MTSALFGPDGTQPPEPDPVSSDALWGPASGITSTAPLPGLPLPGLPLPAAAPTVAPVVAPPAIDPQAPRRRGGAAQSAGPRPPPQPSYAYQPPPPPGYLPPPQSARLARQAQTRPQRPLAAPESDLIRARRAGSGGWVGCVIGLIFLVALLFNPVRALVEALIDAAR